MVTIDGCKLLVDHGEAHGVGVTKLPKLRKWMHNRPNRPVWPNGGSPWGLA